MAVDWDQDLLSDVFDTFGKEVLYTPQSGSPITVKVCERRADEFSDFGQTRIHSKGATFEVRVSDIPNPKSGETLMMDGIVYVLKAAPQLKDHEGHLWILDVYPE